MRTIQQLATEAIDVQNACNPLGLTKGFAQAMTDLHAALEQDKQPNDTSALCNHPIGGLWASKLHELFGMGLSDGDRFASAYERCQELAK